MEIQIFENDQFGKVRTIIDGDGTILFCGADVAKILGYAVPRKAVRDHCRCVLKRNAPHPQSPEKTMELSFIPEPDVYRLIFRSKLPSALAFETWVVSDVLPILRRTGEYRMPTGVAELQANEYTALVVPPNHSSWCSGSAVRGAW